MPIYATPQELAAWLDPDSQSPEIPPLATVLLRTASQLALDATPTARYRTDDNGLPTAPAILNAFKSATLEQAAAWSLHGIDPRKGAAGLKAVVSSKSALGVSVSYSQTAQQASLAQLAAAEELIPAALAYLDNAGLISARVSTVGALGPLVFSDYHTELNEPQDGLFRP